LVKNRKKSAIFDFFFRMSIFHLSKYRVQIWLICSPLVTKFRTFRSFGKSLTVSEILQKQTKKKSEDLKKRFVGY